MMYDDDTARLLTDTARLLERAARRLRQCAESHEYTIVRARLIRDVVSLVDAAHARVASLPTTTEGWLGGPLHARDPE